MWVSKKSSLPMEVYLGAGNSNRAVQDVYRLQPLEHGNPGFEFHSRHACMCVDIRASVLLLVGTGIAMGRFG
jgi:hypothetical protein